MAEKRENWGSKIGLVLAMAGNAVGLGNFWRYPYQAAKNGGGAFMLPYFGALILMGIPLMLVEWNMGRLGGKYGHGTLGPMVYLQAREGVKPRTAIWLGAIAGGLALGVTLLVNSYYNHIIGWTLGYTWLSLTGAYMAPEINTGQFFVDYIQNPGYVFGFWLLALTTLLFTAMGGIQQGIERMAKILMPLIYVFGVILIIRTLTLGAPDPIAHPDWTPIAGLDFIWSPRWEELNWAATMAACGQIFFTLSIGMGIICNYASYLKPDDDIVLSGFTTVALNEIAEVIMGGTIAIPIAYAFMGPEGLGRSIGLSFIALPSLFREMGFGNLMGGIWLLLLAFAGLTSAIAMYNYLVALLMENTSMDRKKSAITVFVGYILVGLPVALEPIITKTADLMYFTEVDNWVGNYFLFVLGMIEIIVTAWLYGKAGHTEMNRGSYWKVPDWFYKAFIQFITPIGMIIVLLMYTIDTAKQGYYKWIPDFVAGNAVLIPWVQAGRVVVFVVVILGTIQAYYGIKKHYNEELVQNQVLIRK